MVDPYINGSTLHLDPLEPGSLCVVTAPDGIMTRLERDTTTTWPLPGAGTYRLGITENGKTRMLLLTVEQSVEQKTAAWREAATMTVPDFTETALAAGLITEADADAWIMRSTIPTVVQSAVNRLPVAQRKRAVRAIMGATAVRRTSPFVALLQQTMSLTDAQVDALFGGPPA